MESALAQYILEVTGASGIQSVETIQRLWSGYGRLDRYFLIGAQVESVIVKQVCLPDTHHHPRGWNTQHSHQRKLDSYRVEIAWYQDWAIRCNADCRVPKALSLQQQKDGFVMVLEDLGSCGFPLVKSTASWEDMVLCLQWLANFHAVFLEEQPQHLWSVGSYWHLATRLDEWESMPAGALKQSAATLDQILRDAPFQTVIHGDAKLANFCFAEHGEQVAGVDFQYVGGGCGIKDVAYFIGSCLDEYECARLEKDLLDVYFEELTKALVIQQPQIDAVVVEAAWRPLYAVAWADFYRFLQGWSPEHWKIHGYSEALAAKVIKQLQEANS